MAELFDYLYETLLSGGWVLVPILLVGAAGFYLSGLAFLEIRQEYFRRTYVRFFNTAFKLLRSEDQQALDEHLKSRPGLVSECLQVAFENREKSEVEVRNILTERMNRSIFLLDRHLPMIGVLSAVAPLLGLLGTVTGMVHTFEVITEFGNSNPLLMAGGISEALITTQSGLIIAFPLVLFRHQLEDRISWIRKQVELAATRFINQNYHYNPNGHIKTDVNQGI